MYTKQEASRLKQAFWTTFGQYMQPVLSADGIKANWINYKTGEPNLAFKMDADSKQAYIAIVLSHSDLGIQELYYEQCYQLKAMLHNTLGEEWDWQPNTTDEYGKTISRIIKVLPNVNVYNNEDWPKLISFFKPRIVALDEFWSMARYGFEALR